MPSPAMEAALNLGWLLLALASLCLWFRGRHNFAPVGRPLAALLPLICALTLLFPAVSASDNFLAEQARQDGEDCSLPAFKSCAPDSDAAIAGKRPALTGIFPPRCSPPGGSVVAWLLFAGTPSSTVLLAHSPTGRAPPNLPSLARNSIQSCITPPERATPRLARELDQREELP